MAPSSSTGSHRGEPEEIGPLIDYLHGYAVSHFGAEESEMRATRYPGYARHKAEHDRFIDDLLAVAEEHDRRGQGTFIALRVSHWLVEWLKQHVSATDAELGRFLARQKS